MKRAPTKYTDAEIAEKLEANGGNVLKTSRVLKVRKARVSAVAKLIGNNVYDKKRKSVFEAAEAAVIHLASVLESTSKRDGENAKATATAYGIAVDKLLLIAGKPISINQNQNTDGPKPIDLTTLSRADILTLLDIHDRANGVKPPVRVSDLTNPVIYDDMAPDGVGKIPEPIESEDDRVPNDSGVS